MNRNTLTEVIRDGRRRRLSDAAIADSVLFLAETDATWAKALSHPARGGILRLMRREGRLSPVAAARELDQSVGAIAYHFRQLHKLGFIEICDTIPRRGATEHVYRLTNSAHVFSHTNHN
jgi:predicted transcriptional regulator